MQAVLDHHERYGGIGKWCWAAQAADALRTTKGLIDVVLATDLGGS
ncbi:hypothetical protein [Streptomyces phaeochromogenes]|nr:hypothetical protein OHB08_50625 [Streptomyces phaeochromogenes]